MLNKIAEVLPNFLGGSADLGPSNNTAIKGGGDFSKTNPLGRNLHFGVREHAMAGIANGIALHKGIRIFCATFLIFSDYMRPSIRLACLMKRPVIYVFTHDSIFVGEDGPTHQPVEQLSGLRIIPGMLVLRPGDAEETVRCWEIALQRKDGPSSLVLTRQKIEVYEKEDKKWQENCAKGAYIVKECAGKPDIVIAATGSEVSLSLSALKKRPDKKIRIVSMPSLELFCSQPESYQDEILSPDAKHIFVEAGMDAGFGNLAQTWDSIISLKRFGESGPGEIVADDLGLNEEAICNAIDKVCGK
jgi:transketolase